MGGAWRPQVNTPPPRASGPPRLPADAGRTSRGWYLLKVSWRFLTMHPSLLVFPAIAAVLLTIATLAIFVPIVASAGGGASRIDIFVASMLTAVPGTLVTVACNVAFLSMVQAVLQGETPTFRDGLRAAAERRGAIVAWAAISLVVGLVLRLVEQLPGGGLIGSLASWLGGLAWALATFFVVPVLIVERVSPPAAIRRSAQTFKKRWGESLTGDITAGAAFGIMAMPGVLVVIVGIDSWGEPAAVYLLAAGALWIAPLVALQSAVTQLFQLVVYREVADGVVPAPFTSADTQAVFRPRTKRRFFGR